MIYDIDIIYDKFKTGDLILFRSKRWIRYFTYFTHVGMIVDFNGKKYILDLNKKKSKTFGVKSGVKMYDLYDRIKQFKGDIYILSIDKNINIINKFFLNLNNYFNIKFDSNICINLIKIKLNIKLKNRDGMFCSEFIGYILQDLDILDKSYNIYTIFPKTFLKLKDVNGNQIYDNLYKIKK